jgi:hypothetical protein
MSASTRAKAARSLAAILSQPAISPEELHASGLIPVGRNGIYEACGNGEIECFRVGKKIIIPTAPLRRKLGIEAA